IVVAGLAVAKFIAAENERNALRQQQAGKLIAPQLLSQSDDLRVVGGAFDTAIDAGIIIGAVVIVLAICVIVLGRVTHKIGESKAVVYGNVIDAGARAAAGVLKQVGRSGHAAADVSDQVALARPIPAQRSAVPVIPLRPAGRKATDLIAT